MTKAKPTLADAEATLREAIRQGIICTRGQMPKEDLDGVVDGVFNFITEYSARWALVMIGMRKKV